MYRLAPSSEQEPQTTHLEAQLLNCTMITCPITAPRTTKAYQRTECDITNVVAGAGTSSLKLKRWFPVTEQNLWGGLAATATLLKFLLSESEDNNKNPSSPGYFNMGLLLSVKAMAVAYQNGHPAQFLITGWEPEQDSHLY